MKEVYLTLQGEGANAGRVAVFLRFAGCNLWSGRAEDRGKGRGSCAAWCDTDFVRTDGPGGGRFRAAAELAAHAASTWGAGLEHRFVVCTGGEPLLQLDDALVDALHALRFTVAVETNGTLPAPAGLDWVCVSPKCGAELVLRAGNELKLVVPQDGLDPAIFEAFDFQHFFVQPMDGPALLQNERFAIDYCMRHPRWRLGLQTHKMIGIR